MKPVAQLQRRLSCKLEQGELRPTPFTCKLGDMDVEKVCVPNKPGRLLTPSPYSTNIWRRTSWGYGRSRALASTSEVETIQTLNLNQDVLSTIQDEVGLVTHSLWNE